MYRVLCVGLTIVFDIVPKTHLNGFEIGTPRPVIRHPPTVTIRAVIDIVTMLRFWPCSGPSTQIQKGCKNPFIQRKPISCSCGGVDRVAVAISMSVNCRQQVAC